MSERSLSFVNEELAQLKENLLLMGGVVESMMTETRDALVNSDPELARKIILRDQQVDKLESDTDEIAVSILSLQTLAPRDLRFVCAALKITTDIERMGDVVRNLCERIEELPSLPKLPLNEDLLKMFDLATNSIARSLDAFVNLSSQDATEALHLDHSIDELNEDLYRQFVEQMKKSPDQIEGLMKYIYVAKYLERIGDHAMNVAQQVIFVVEGVDVRHSDVNRDV